MGVGAEETATQAIVVAAAAEQVTRNLQTVAAATEEMTASIGEISKNASTAAGVAGLAVERMRAADITMNHLGKSSAEISEVCQGRSKSRPLGRRKTRPEERVGDRGLSGRVASGAEACGPALRTAFRPERKTPHAPRRSATRIVEGT